MNSIVIMFLSRLLYALNLILFSPSWSRGLKNCTEFLSPFVGFLLPNVTFETKNSWYGQRCIIPLNDSFAWMNLRKDVSSNWDIRQVRQKKHYTHSNKVTFNQRKRFNVISKSTKIKVFPSNCSCEFFLCGYPVSNFKVTLEWSVKKLKIISYYFSIYL